MLSWAEFPGPCDVKIDAEAFIWEKLHHSPSAAKIAQHQHEDPNYTLSTLDAEGDLNEENLVQVFCHAADPDSSQTKGRQEYVKVKEEFVERVTERGQCLDEYNKEAHESLG